MENLIKEIENIKNYNERINKLLSDEVINKIDKTYIINLFKSESEYRQILFLKNPNFYKVITSEELYDYIKSCQGTTIYNFLQIDNVLNSLNEVNDIGSLIEQIKIKILIKKLILNDNIFDILESEYNYKPIVIFKDDKEVREYLENKDIPENIKNYFTTNNSKDLYDEEKEFLIEHTDTKELLNLLDNEEINKHIKDLYEIYRTNQDKVDLMKNDVFRDLLFKEDLEKIINENNKNVNKIILDSPDLYDILDGFMIYSIMKNNPLEYLHYLSRIEISDKFTYDVIKSIISSHNNKDLYILLSKNIVNNINVIELMKYYLISKKEIISILIKVNIGMYKKSIILSLFNNDYKMINELEKFIVFDLYNHRSSDILEELKEEVKDGTLCKNINIDYILEKIYKNPDYEISSEYFEIVLSRLFENILHKTSEQKDFIMKPLYDDNGYRSEKGIFVDSKIVGNSLNKNINTFSTFFHELTHEKQFLSLSKNNDSYTNLKIIKDEILRNMFEDYYNSSYYMISSETHAFVQGYIDAIRFYRKNVGKIPNDGFIKEIKKNLILKKSTDRKIGNDNYNLLTLFDKFVSKEDIIEYSKLYNVILLEYNSDGSRKSLDEVIRLYSKYKREYMESKSKESLRKYKFYKNLLDDLSLKNQSYISEDDLENFIESVNLLNDSNDETYNIKVKQLKSRF